MIEKLLKGVETDTLAVTGQPFASDVARLFDHSLLDTSTTIGYHGTSLQALEAIVRTGILPGNSREGVSPSLLQHFSFFPNAELFYSHPDAEKFPPFEQVRERCGSYAAQLAGEHFLAERWNLAIENPIHYQAIEEMYEGRFYNALGANSRLSESSYHIVENLGLNNKVLREDVALAWKQKGVILAFGLAAADYPISSGDFEEGDLKIQVSDGLPVTCLSGIEPLGPKEREYLEGLRRDS